MKMQEQHNNSTTSNPNCMSTPPSAYTTIKHSHRLHGLSDLPETREEEEQEQTGDRERQTQAGRLANRKVERAKRNSGQARLALTQGSGSGHARSLDDEIAVLALTKGDKPADGLQLLELKKRSQSAKGSLGPDSSQAQPGSRSLSTLPALSGKSTAAVPKGAKSTSGKKDSSKSRKALADKDTKEEAGLESVWPREQNGRSDSSAVAFWDKLHPTDQSRINNSSVRQGRRRFPSSRSDESNVPLNDSPGEMASHRGVSSDRLQHSSNGMAGSEEGCDDHPRGLRQPISDRGGTGGGGGGESGLVSPTSSLPTGGPRLWDVFEEHVRTIQDSSDLISRRQGPSFQASSTFQEAMADLFGCQTYSPPAHPQSAHQAAHVQRKLGVPGVVVRSVQSRRRSSFLGAAQGGLESASGQHKQQQHEQLDRKMVENAKRGWRILRQYVHDNYASKRTSAAALSWSMLRQTFRGMTDREKSCLDLYRRYGIVPSPDERGNLVMVNTMLSKRAQKAIAKGARHPLLVHSLSVPGISLTPPAGTAPVAAATARTSSSPTTSLSSSAPSSSVATRTASRGEGAAEATQGFRWSRGGVSHAGSSSRPVNSVGGSPGGHLVGPGKFTTRSARSVSWVSVMKTAV